MKYFIIPKQKTLPFRNLWIRNFLKILFIDDSEMIHAPSGRKKLTLIMDIIFRDEIDLSDIKYIYGHATPADDYTTVAISIDGCLVLKFGSFLLCPQV